MNAASIGVPAQDDLSSHDDAFFAESVLRDMRKREAEWTDGGRLYSWIDREPIWIESGDLRSLYNDCGDWVFPEPTEPCRFIYRLSLLGGGQIRVTERFVRCHPELCSAGFPTWRESVSLKVTAHTENGIRIVFGEIYRGPIYEMNAQAVVMRTGTQDIADRVADTFRLIGNQLENFLALLDGTTGCALCGRSLRDEISKLIAIGPDCARQSGLPHNRKAAETRLELRRKLLGENSRAISAN